MWILVPDQGGREFRTGGIHRYFEDLKRAPNTDMGAKDFFEIASNQLRDRRQVIRPARRRMNGSRDVGRDIDKDRVDPLNLVTCIQLSEEGITAGRWRRHEHLS